MPAPNYTRAATDEPRRAHRSRTAAPRRQEPRRRRPFRPQRHRRAAAAFRLQAEGRKSVEHLVLLCVCLASLGVRWVWSQRRQFDSIRTTDPRTVSKCPSDNFDEQQGTSSNAAGKWQRRAGSGSPAIGTKTHSPTRSGASSRAAMRRALGAARSEADRDRRAANLLGQGRRGLDWPLGEKIGRRLG